MSGAESQKWLVTLQASVNLDDFLTRANSIGFSTTANTQAVPMPEKEVVVELSGDSTQRSELLQIPGVKAVHPSSELELH